MRKAKTRAQKRKLLHKAAELMPQADWSCFAIDTAVLGKKAACTKIADLTLEYAAFYEFSTHSTTPFRPREERNFPEDVLNHRVMALLFFAEVGTKAIR